MQSTIAVVLGGGQGKRLFPLTALRSKPAVPIGGKYRLIDIPVSLAINSGISTIYVLTQFNSTSLNRHIATTYAFDPFRGGFVLVLAASQHSDDGAALDWYQGTADAVRKNLRTLLAMGPELVLILSGDHLYRMDFRRLADFHRARGADVTVMVTPVPEARAPSFGLLHLEGGSIRAFSEKPSGPELEAMRSPIGPGGETGFLGSMGIYLFNRAALERALAVSSGNDFGRDIIPEAIRSLKVAGYRFDGYWEDIGTIGSFYEANMAMLADAPPYPLFHPTSPLFSRPRFLPPARLDGCTVERSLVSDGSLLDRSVVERSIVGLRSIVRAGCRIEQSLLMGADAYRLVDGAGLPPAGAPPLGIGENSVVRRAIIDKNACIGRDVRLVNAAGVAHGERDGVYIRDGIVIVPKNGVVPDGTAV